MPEIFYKEESYLLTGLLYEVHNNLGGGFSEIVYKDALEFELKKLNVPFVKRKRIFGQL